MNTHIIIKIEDLQQRINNYKEIQDSDYKKYDIYAALVSELETIKSSEKLTKQISLDEKGIEEKAWEFVKPAENALKPCKSDGYNEFEVYDSIKRALKDLI